MKQKIISLFVMLCCSCVWAQNTSREPMQGGATNPVTQQEADHNSDQQPLSELVKKKKRKPKTTITAEPDKTSTGTTTSTPPADATTSTPTKK